MINEYAEFRDIIRDIIREEIEKYFKQNSVEKKYGGIVTAIYPFIEIIRIKLTRELIPKIKKEDVVVGHPLHSNI